MLKKFSVENFKNFRDRIVLDLSSADDYIFNTDVVCENCITKGIVFGLNGCGKSNLGLAIFDIVLHLTDKEKLNDAYRHYLNLTVKKSCAQFEYTFQFDGRDVLYRYRKTSGDKLIEEQLFIDGYEVLHYNFLKQEGFSRLKGTETLRLAASSPISRVKYIKNNAILAEDEINRTFSAFVDFVDRMLLFSPLETRGYQGYQVGHENIAAGIIESGKTKAFEQFLRTQGIDYQLVERAVDGQKALYCALGDREADLFQIASSGTVALAQFYHWYLKLRDVSLVFIDDFDAFYHSELASAVVRLLGELKHTQVLLTTHTTDLITNDLLRPDCYFLLADQKIAPISSLTDKELRKEHNLQRMYKAGAFAVNGRWRLPERRERGVQ